MDNENKLEIYQAQVKNVRSLKECLGQVRRSINAAIRSNDMVAVNAYTRIYALLYCSWSEAAFSKTLHTPYGFDLSEIQQVQAAKRSSVADGWKKSVELGLRHLQVQQGSFKPNAKQKLFRLIDRHISDPSKLRNKLAHGQWAIALNRSNEAVNDELTQQIIGLDIVKIDAMMTGHTLLSNLVEHLIESPTKAFMRDWYQYVVRIEEDILASEGRTIAEHSSRLKRKMPPSRSRI